MDAKPVMPVTTNVIPLNHVPNSKSDGGKPSTKQPVVIVVKRETLTTKKAVELLLSGTLKSKVCRFCLYVTAPLSELDQYMQIADKYALYKVTIRDIVASIYPFQVSDDPNFPNKICEKCLDKAIQCYRFAQQTEQAGRALRNCFEHLYEKFDKLDPLERPKKRGRHKLHPNTNTLYTEHKNVIDYAEPIRHLIQTSSLSLENETPMTSLECKKCWQILPDLESLAAHEKQHPKTMWYNCRTCGKSFAKKGHIKKHLQEHDRKKRRDKSKPTDFVCKQCDHKTEYYNLHLQHIEKHKFKKVFEHLIERRMDKLCSVCFSNNHKTIEMNKMICLHGGYPELTGDRTLYHILAATIPEINIITNHTGTKICEKCLDHAITSYVFINKTHSIRDRLNTCITNMIESLKDVKNDEKICIEIVQNGIMPITETYDENLLLDDDDEVDETKLKVDVLEDEYRIKSDDESDDEKKVPEPKKYGCKKVTVDVNKMVNGFKIKSDIGEFLTFKKERKDQIKPKCQYTCPLCNKKFISDYFMKRHILKHTSRKVECKHCLRVLSSKFHLYEHVKVEHFTKNKNFSLCRICGRAFKNHKKLTSHERIHTKKQCELCLKTFKFQNYYNNHMQRHAYKLNLLRRLNIQNCSFCEKECFNENDLSVHVNKVHLQVKSYNCDMCSKKFYSEPNLRQHKKVHTMFSIHKCELCSKLFKCRRNLVVHVRKHMGIKPFQCSICPEAFFSEKRVRQHMKTWHGGSFFCKLCKKVFVNKKGLKDHVNGAHSIF